MAYHVRDVVQPTCSNAKVHEVYDSFFLIAECRTPFVMLDGVVDGIVEPLATHTRQ